MTNFYSQDSMRRHSESTQRIRYFLVGLLVGALVALAWVR